MTRRVGSLLSFVLHITFAVRLCLCLRLRLAWRPARSWVQRAEVSRRFLGSLLLLLLLGKILLFFFFLHPFFPWGLLGVVSPLHAGLAVPASSFFSLHVLSFDAGFFRHGSAFQVRGVKTAPTSPSLCFLFFFVFALLLVQELFFPPSFFFCVFCLLVALNITSGDLKLCRECVIVEFCFVFFF